MIVRQATQLDEEDCVGMTVSFLQMTPYNKYKLSYDSLAITFRAAMDSGLAFVAEEDGLVIGMIIGAKSSAMFNSNIIIGQELGWWVDEEYRDTKAGVALLKAFEDACSDCDIISMSLLSTSEQKLRGYLTSIGYTEAETAYFKEN